MTCPDYIQTQKLSAFEHTLQKHLVLYRIVSVYIVLCALHSVPLPATTCATYYCVHELREDLPRWLAYGTAATTAAVTQSTYITAV